MPDKGQCTAYRPAGRTTARTGIPLRGAGESEDTSRSRVPTWNGRTKQDGFGRTFAEAIPAGSPKLSSFIQRDDRLDPETDRRRPAQISPNHLWTAFLHADFCRR